MPRHNVALVEKYIGADAANLLVGVTASVVAALILGLFTGLLFPGLRWLFQRRTVDLRGDWDVYDSLIPDGTPVGVWHVRQRGNHVRVRIRRIVNRSGGAMKRDFSAVGDLQADQLTCVFHDQTGRHRTGAIVLRMRGSQSPLTFSGRTVYWDRTPERGDVLDEAGVVAYAYSIRRRQD